MNIREIVQKLYPDRAQSVYEAIMNVIETHKTEEKKSWVTEKDVMLITYGDSLSKAGENPLYTLDRFLNEQTEGQIENVHILPMFPYSSDDGFSVIDYEKIDLNLGTWEDMERLSRKHGLMFDAVINHISQSSAWFKKFLQEDETYRDYFIEVDPNLDYGDVVRPRALPLYYPYDTKSGIKHIWATFSRDQVDLNYRNPDVLVRILEILIGYAEKGARFIRFDAIGFLWKEVGTPSIHLPETHLLIKLMRHVLDLTVPGTIIVTETNVPHQENVSYFGNGHDEAHMVYQFPLPPLVLFSFVSGKARKLLLWADRLKDTPLTEETTYFNFLASHDGIGMRPVEDILTDFEKNQLIERVTRNGGTVSYRNNKDGTKTPYELNISYLDAVTSFDDTKGTRVAKFLASQVILLSVIGVPGIYVHSLIGSANDLKGFRSSNIPRRINREKLDYDRLVEELEDEHSIRHLIFTEYLELLKIRRKHKAFSPNADQRVLFLDDRVFSIIRRDENTNQHILVLVNVSNAYITLNTGLTGMDIKTGSRVSEIIDLSPYRYRWIELEGSLS